LIALLALGATSGAARLAAQQGGEPHLYLSIFGGGHTGQELWLLEKQPIIVLPSQYDTLDLGRTMASGFIVGASGAYFPGPHIGFEAEIALMSMTLESSCSIRQSQPPVVNDIGPALCASVQGQGVSNNAVSFSVGVIARALADRSLHPYVRLDAGIVSRTHSTIEMIGSYVDPDGNVVSQTLVSDENPDNTGPHVTAAFGLALSLGPGYQLRLEGRDLMMQLDRVTGQGNANSVPLVLPHSEHIYHIFALTVALDVILEKQHHRRY